MSAHEQELHRLTAALRQLNSTARNAEEAEAARMGAAALCLVFAKGLWRELAEMDEPLTEEMKQHLRQCGLDPEGTGS